MGNRSLVEVPVAACLVFVCACQPDTSLDPVELDPGTVAVTGFGDLESGNVLGSVQDAAISPSGRYLAVLDRDDPHLRVLDRESNISNVFGMEGGGPGEVEFPMSITFLGDSVLALLRSGAIDFFSPEGALRTTIHTSELGIRAQAITDGCDALFLYGISGEEDGSREPHWLHRIEVKSSSQEPIPFLPLAGRSALKWGALEGLDGSDSAILLWHRPHTVESGWVFDCEQQTARLLDQTKSEVEVRAALREGGSGGMALTLPDTLFSGAVAYAGNFLVGHTVRSESGEYTAGHTLLRSWGPNGTGCITVRGRWLILDAAADLVAMATSEPFPRLFLLPFSSVGGAEVLGRPCG